MGRITLSLGRWVVLSAFHEERMALAAARGAGDGDATGPRRVYIDRAAQAALLLLERLREGVPRRTAQDPPPDGPIREEDIAIDNFTAELECEEAERLLLYLGLRDGKGGGCSREEEEVLYISEGSLHAICLSASLEKKSFDEELWRSTAHLPSVGRLLYLIFSRGEGPPPGLGSNGLKHPPEELAGQSAQQKKANRIGIDFYEQLFPKDNVPTSICRLIGDLVEPHREDVEPFNSLDEVISELKQLSERPEEYLRFTSTVPTRLEFGEEVYGRMDELHTLLQAAARVSTEEDSTENRLVLIRGASGSGKSMLVKAIEEPLSRWGYVHISTKFERLAQHQPLSIIASALNEFFQTVVTQIQALNNQAVGNYANNIVESMERELGVSGIIALKSLMPSLRALFPNLLRRTVSDPDLTALAEQEMEPRRGPEQGNVVESDEEEGPATTSAETSSNRLHYIFRKLVRAISSPDYPILLFLDDLQWADRSSLDLISSLLLDFDHLDYGNENASSCFLVVCAYRDNEVNESHLLSPYLAKFDESDSVRVSKIALGALREDCANLMVSKAMSLPTRLTKTLTGVIMGKTAGNPFHLKTFLQSLVADQIVHYSLVERRWSWDLESVKAVSIDASVAELLTKRLLQLPDNIQSALKVISCFGSLGQGILQLLTQLDEYESLVEGLEGARSENILEEDNHGYKFAHDLLQQTSYELMDEEERLRCHYELGMQLISTMPAGESAGFGADARAAIFQINRARAFDNKQGPFNLQFAQLNLISGKQLVGISDFVGALSYTDYGLKFLPESAWETQHSLCLALHENAALSSYALGFMDKMKTYLEEVFKHADSLEDKLFGYYMLIRSLASAGSMVEAADKLFSILNQLGQDFPDTEDMTPALIQKELIATKKVVEGLTQESILAPRRLSQAREIWAVKFLSLFIHYLYMTRPKYLPLAASRVIEISVASGYTSASALGFLGFGQSLIALQDIENGIKMGKMALLLLEGLGTKEYLAGVKVKFYTAISIFQEPLQAIIDLLRENQKESLAVGENEEASLSSFACCRFSIFAGDHLPKSLLECTYASLTMSRLQQVNGRIALALLQGIILQLMGSDKNPLDAFAETLPFKTEGSLLSFALSKRMMAIVSIVNQKKMFLAFWQKRYEEAWEAASKYDNRNTLGIAYVTHEIYEGLIAFQLARRSGDTTKLNAGERALSLVRNWANHCSWTFENKSLLLEAECHFSKGAMEEAEEKYQAAIESARRHRFVHEEGLANELFADFLTSCGKTDQAKLFLTRARACYETWGAVAVVARLDGIDIM